MEKTIVTITDDITGRESKGIETLSFSFEGVAYEIDLNPLNAANFRRSMNKYISRGRKASASQKVDVRKVSHNREYVHTVREWAARNGIEVARRGRVPQSVYERFEAANK